jgi:hypothetical protein
LTKYREIMNVLRANPDYPVERLVPDSDPKTRELYTRLGAFLRPLAVRHALPTQRSVDEIDAIRRAVAAMNVHVWKNQDDYRHWCEKVGIQTETTTYKA